MELTTLVSIGPYLEHTFFSQKKFDVFLCFVDIFCYLDHSPLWANGSYLLGDCQLHNID